MFQFSLWFINRSKHGIYFFFVNMNENLASIWLSFWISNQNESNFQMAQQSEIRMLFTLRRDGSFSSKIDLCSCVAVWPKNRAENTLNALWMEGKKVIIWSLHCNRKTFQDDARSGYFQFMWRLHRFLHSLNSTSFFFLFHIRGLVCASSIIKSSKVWNDIKMR